MYTLFQQWRTRSQNSIAHEVGQVLHAQGYTDESTRLINAFPPPIAMSDVASHSLQHGRGGLEFGSFLGCVPSSGVTIGLCCNNLAATGGLPSITSPLCWISSCLPCGSAVACGLFGCLLCSIPTFICGNLTEGHEHGDECAQQLCHGGIFSDMCCS